MRTVLVIAVTVAVSVTATLVRRWVVRHLTERLIQLVWDLSTKEAK